MQNIEPIARIYNDLPSKFGIPRQSGIVKSLKSRIVFEPKYRIANALRGLEEFSHIWLIWGFSEQSGKWSPTVRPPRLGGNVRLGVFATRSPNRPNSLGMSAVQLQAIEHDTPDGSVLHVLGADLMNGTPVFDIKPYLPYADSHPGATAGFAPSEPAAQLEVIIPGHLRAILTEEAWSTVAELLALDPRPPFHDDPERVYGMEYAEQDVRFTVCGDVLTVVAVEKRK